MILKLLITYEILIINLFLTHILAKRKYSNFITFSCLLLFTIVLGVSLYFITPLFSGAEPTFWFVLAGSFYFLPLYFLYEINTKKLIIIMIYSWTYTMILSAIAVGLSAFITIMNDLGQILIIQTILTIVTLRNIVLFTKNKFIVVVNNAGDKTKNLLMILGISLFSSVSVIRYSVDPEDSVYFLIVVFLIIIIVTSYNLLFNNVEANVNLASANKIVYHDSLTGIGNRYLLFKDINELLSDETPFTLLFLDLDDLKLVNDTFGHNTGDAYLNHFAKSLIVNTKDFGNSYRFAGDEFVCLIKRGLKPFDLTKFENEIKKEMNLKFEFNGFSCGSSKYPEDGNDPDVLIQVADSKMYGVKNSKRIRNYNFRKK